MNKRIAFTLLIIVSMATACAQNTIESIRAEYKDVHEMIAHMATDKEGLMGAPPVYYNVNIVQNLPGTGAHRHDIRMYYGDLESDEEGDPYPPHYLRFVTSRYNYAARVFYEEYLFDKNGKLMFVYAVTPDAVDDETIYRELRLWFDGKRLLRFNVKKAPKGYQLDDYENLKKIKYEEEYTGTSIPEKYRDATDKYMSSAKRFLNMFEAIDEN